MASPIRAVYEDAKEFARSSWMLFQGVIVGIVVFGISLLLDVVDVYERWIGPMLPSSLRVDIGHSPLVIGGVAILVGVLHTYHKLRVKNSALEEHYQKLTTPVLEMEFGDGFPYMVYYNEGEEDIGDDIITRFRIGVRNRALQTVDQIRAQIEKAEPSYAFPYSLPVPLQLMMDELPCDKKSVVEFSLSPGEVRFVNLLEYAFYDHIPPEYDNTLLAVRHGGRNQLQDIKRRECLLTVVMYGRDVLPVQGQFEIRLDEVGRVSVKRIV